MDLDAPPVLGAPFESDPDEADFIKKLVTDALTAYGQKEDSQKYGYDQSIVRIANFLLNFIVRLKASIESNLQKNKSSPEYCTKSMRNSFYQAMRLEIATLSLSSRNGSNQNQKLQA